MESDRTGIEYVDRSSCHVTSKQYFRQTKRRLQIQAWSVPNMFCERIGIVINLSFFLLSVPKT